MNIEEGEICLLLLQSTPSEIFTGVLAPRLEIIVDGKKYERFFSAESNGHLPDQSQQ